MIETRRNLCNRALVVLRVLAYFAGTLLGAVAAAKLLTAVYGHSFDVASVSAGIALLALAALPVALPRSRWRIGRIDLRWPTELILWFLAVIHAGHFHGTQFLFPAAAIAAALVGSVLAGMALVVLGRRQPRVRSRARAVQVILLMVGLFDLMSADSFSQRFPQVCSELSGPPSAVRPLFLFSWCRSPGWESAPLCPFAISKAREIARVGDRVLGSVDTIDIRGRSEGGQTALYSIELGTAARRQSALLMRGGRITNPVVMEGSDLVYVMRLDAEPSEVLGVEVGAEGLVLRDRVPLSGAGLSAGLLLADPVARRLVLIPEDVPHLPSPGVSAHLFDPLTRAVCGRPDRHPRAGLVLPAVA